MQGTCSFPDNATINAWNLTGPPLLQLKPAQCIVICDTDCVRVRGTPVWLHNIYLRFFRTERSDKPQAVLEDNANEVCFSLHEYSWVTSSGGFGGETTSDRRGAMSPGSGSVWHAACAAICAA